MKIKTILLVILLLTTTLYAFKTEDPTLKLPAIFADGMVLQQKTNVYFWGYGAKNSKVQIEASWGAKAETTTDNSGKWKVALTTIAAGGPYTIQIKCGTSIITYNDVLLGEVWLASGQSNMEMPLKGWPPNDTILGSTNEIALANNNQIRMFTVTKAVSLVPLDSVKGYWQFADNQQVGEFSATAYFFAKELYKTLKVPVGIINTSWGGTPVESWISKNSLKTQPDFTDFINNLELSIPKNKEMIEWLQQLPQLEPKTNRNSEMWSSLEFNDQVCASVDFNDASLKTITLPGTFEAGEIGHFDGNVWFRKVFEVPQSFVNQELIVELGPVDDMDVTYINGVKIGGYEEGGFWNTNRVYKVPENLIKAGKNLIAIRVMDTQGGGGIYGKPEQLLIYPKNNKNQSVSLSGSWKYLPTAEYQNGKFYLFNIETKQFYTRPNAPVQNTAFTATCLYNAMIAPLIPYTIKGAIWYQGESNVGRAEQYSRIFPLMIQNWRSDWQLGNFPFYYVQIAPYNYGIGAKSEELREAQRFTLTLENTGMAVTMDITDLYNIHPANKLDVGKRLAFWALAKDYKQPLVYSGPIYKDINIVKDKAVISFHYADKGLKAAETGLSGFEIAGSDGVFKTANAVIDGQKVIVSSSEVKNPKIVRYGWSNMAAATLFNMAGLPASSFITKKIW